MRAARCRPVHDKVNVGDDDVARVGVGTEWAEKIFSAMVFPESESPVLLAETCGAVTSVRVACVR